MDDSLLHPPLVARAAPPERLTVRRADAFAFERDEAAKGLERRGVIIAVERRASGVRLSACHGLQPNPLLGRPGDFPVQW